MLPSWSTLKSTPARLRTRVSERAKRTADQGQERVWSLSTRALEQAHDLLDRADDLPAVGRLAGAVNGLVEGGLERLLAVPVEGWDTLNAKDAIAAVNDLGRAGLHAARRHEVATKNRKTVLRAIDARLGQKEAAA